MRAALVGVALLAACSSTNGSGPPPPPAPPPFYVANTGSNTITVFTTDDTGNVAPTLTIGGANTGLDQPQGILLDATGVLLVTSVNPPRILVFAAHAVGDVAPIASIVGANTGLVQPKGLALDASGRPDLRGEQRIHQPPVSDHGVRSGRSWQRRTGRDARWQ